MLPLKSILHPTDFSEHSRHALELACALARDQDARVVLLHVLPRPLSPAGVDAPAFKAQHNEEDLKAYRDEMKGLLEKMREKASYAKVEPLLKDGDVATAICASAKETGSELIVMGSHGKSRIHQLMMGSVAAEVSRKAQCPVVTVKIPAT